MTDPNLDTLPPLTGAMPDAPVVAGETLDDLDLEEEDEETE